MIVLAVRTDRAEAYLGLFDGEKQLAEVSWKAHRELSATIFTKIESLLPSQQLELKNISGFVCFEGPGSFTGLRIGLSAVNALAYSLGVPVVATGGEDWIANGIKRLSSGDDDKVAMPVYGQEAHITTPKK